ncbi:MAG TPA: LytTR family DNA-binding domain-containing protein [Candidatus Binatia bacterium]|nr:LytTR family DNA-binding domain-containing protein [Candidatus Binatia bacterium]
MRVLIVDDEPLARTALASILAGRGDVDHCDSAADAIEAQEQLSKQSYDVMLLDIAMPELSGLELLGRLESSKQVVPSVVLVTAYAQHAVEAFEKHAVDYVLKPFSPERVNRAIDFAGRRSASERAAKLMEWVPHLRNLGQPNSSKIAIKSNGKILFVDPGDVVAVESQGNYVLLHRQTGSYLLRESISAIADKLKPHGFLRIHRSACVNTTFVEEIRPLATGEYQLRLKGGKQYTVTRTYKKNLKSLAALWIGTGTVLEQK